MPRNDVDFAESRAVAPINNFVPLPTQLRARKILPENAQCLPTIAAHAGRRSTIHATRPGRAHPQVRPYVVHGAPQDDDTARALRARRSPDVGAGLQARPPTAASA